MSNKRNYAQRHNYMCGSSVLSDLPFFAQTVNLPGITFTLPETRTPGGASVINMSSDSVNFNSLSLEVIVDEDYKIYKDILNAVFNHLNVETGSFADFCFDFWVAVTDDMGKIVLKNEYHNCRIESIGDISLESMDSSNEITFSLDLKYDYFTVDTVSGVSLPSLKI